MGIAVCVKACMHVFCLMIEHAKVPLPLKYSKIQCCTNAEDLTQPNYLTITGTRKEIDSCLSYDH